MMRSSSLVHGTHADMPAFLRVEREGDSELVLSTAPLPTYLNSSGERVLELSYKYYRAMRNARIHSRTLLIAANTLGHRVSVLEYSIYVNMLSNPMWAWETTLLRNFYVSVLGYSSICCQVPGSIWEG